MSDGVLEVVGVTDVVHLALSLGGLSNGVRICQGKQLSIRCEGGGVPLQIDGEPCNLTPAGPMGSEGFRMDIAHEDQVYMLARGPRGGAGGKGAYDVIEGQLGSKALSTKQRDALLSELG